MIHDLFTQLLAWLSNNVDESRKQGQVDVNGLKLKSSADEAGSVAAWHCKGSSVSKCRVLFQGRHVEG